MLNSASLIQSRLEKVLDMAIDSLDPMDRELLLVRFGEHQTTSEVATLLAISLDGVSARSDLALDRLCAILGRLGVSCSNAAVIDALSNEPAPAAKVIEVAELALKAAEALPAENGRH